MQRFVSARSAMFAVLVLAAVVLFHIVIGLPLLSADHDYWLEPGGDMATMMAGHYAIIDQPWHFPLGVTTALRGEAVPTSIVYTDSLPWLTLIMKALGLGRVLNPLALFLLIAYVAQALAMVALLRACGVRRLSSLLLGGLLSLFFPAWLSRQLGHIALAGHFLLILGATWTVLVARFGLTRRRIIEIAMLGLVATGTHPYHLVPVAACLGAGLLSELLQRRAKAWTNAAVTAVAFVAAVAFAAWALGYGGVGMSGGGVSLGSFSMNVLGPLWPQASALAGQTWNGVWFTGTLEVLGQPFEGYNYLGAGVLLIVFAAGVQVVIGLVRGRKPDAAAWRRFGPLIAALVVLTVYAIGPRPYFGPFLMFDVGRPTGLFGDIVGLFRCHGRFFWIVGYAILAFGVVQVDRLQPGRLGIGLLVLALAPAGRRHEPDDPRRSWRLCADDAFLRRRAAHRSGARRPSLALPAGDRVLQQCRRLGDDADVASGVAPPRRLQFRTGGPPACGQLRGRVGGQGRRRARRPDDHRRDRRPRREACPVRGLRPAL
ncbi:hypothetical protein [Caulobacter sp. UC70_42]|uniref:hypothetical protein n=1 Tax=Caulobacter sp. UC70_42 TaxID=3374551 RepID=UPI0037573E5B